MKEAMHEIESSSCVRFAAHDPRNGTDYAMIRKSYYGSGSYADIGCIHVGEQKLSLDVGMVNERRSILSLLLHTIGFRHHHQRSDRDKYIEIHLNNTYLSYKTGKANFASLIKPDDNVTFATPFDFNSVLLYDDLELSVNGRPVIISKVEGKQPPSSRDRNRGLSKYDIILLNLFYDCDNVDKKKSKNFYENEDAKVDNDHEIEQPKDILDNYIRKLNESLANSSESVLPSGRSKETYYYDSKQYEENGSGNSKSSVDDFNDEEKRKEQAANIFRSDDTNEENENPHINSGASKLLFSVVVVIGSRLFSNIYYLLLTEGTLF